MGTLLEFTETSFSVEMIEQVYNYIELAQGIDLSVEGFVTHLKESYENQV